MLVCFSNCYIALHFDSASYSKPWGVSSVPFPFSISLSITLQTSKFRNQITISSKYFDMACYLKGKVYSVPISFEVQRNDIRTDFIQSFEMPLQWELELVTESQLGTNETPHISSTVQFPQTT